MEVVAIRKDFGVNQSMSLPRLALAFLLAAPLLQAVPLSADQLRSAISSNDVVWTEPGHGSADSMPLGNGDIGLNVWTEQNGDVVFYIGKTDSWTENPVKTTGLAKVGKVRFTCKPALFADRKSVV